MNNGEGGEQHLHVGGGAVMRFTGSLRAQGADSALPTPDVLYIQANKALDEERKRRDRASGLAERIFGETPVPKAVRSLVSGFV